CRNARAVPSVAPAAGRASPSRRLARGRPRRTARTCPRPERRLAVVVAEHSEADLLPLLQLGRGQRAGGVAWIPDDLSEAASVRDTADHHARGVHPEDAGDEADTPVHLGPVITGVEVVLPARADAEKALGGRVVGQRHWRSRGLDGVDGSDA